MEIDRTAKNEELCSYLQGVMADLRHHQSSALHELAGKLQGLFGTASIPETIEHINKRLLSPSRL